MELIPIKSQFERGSRLCVLQNKLNTAKYFLDENMAISEEEKQSGEYIHLTQVLRPGTPDKWVLNYAMENNLKIITHDNGMVIRALTKNQDVYFEDGWNRFYFDGKNSQLVKTNCKQPDWKSIAAKRKQLKHTILYARNPTQTLSFF